MKLDLLYKNKVVWLLCTKGACNIYLNNKFVKLTPQWSCWLYPLVSYKVLGWSEDCRVMCISKDIGDYYGESLLAPVRKSIFALRNHENCCFFLTKRNYSKFKNTIKEIDESNIRLKLLTNKDMIHIEKYYQSMCIHALGMKMTIMKNLSIQKVEIYGIHEADIVTRFLQLVWENCKKERKTRFYAESLSVSISTLTKCTMMLMGKTPTKLIAENTITQIIGEIIKPSASIAHIADEFNFSDISNMYRFFKANTGYSITGFVAKMTGLSQ